MAEKRTLTVDLLTQEDLGKRIGIVQTPSDPLSDEWILKAFTPQIGYLVKMREQADDRIHLVIASNPDQDYRQDPYWQVDYIVEPKRGCVVVDG